MGDFKMGFFLGIAFGMMTYYGLFEYLNFSDNFSTAAGWAVGLIFATFSEAIEKLISNIGPGNNKLLKAHIRALVTENDLLRENMNIEKKTKIKMDFFKQAEK